MRALLVRFGCLLSLLVAASASAVSMAWTPIGNLGNACDPQSQGCFGAVSHSYSIGTYEVTNSQYVEFLNAVAVRDANLLYNMGMQSYGITRTGIQGSYSYNVQQGFADRPVQFIALYDALRFVNWIQNGQPVGPQDRTTTEDGAYTFNGYADVGVRNENATIFLPTEDEWYKAAYYDASASRYFDFPTSSDVQPGCRAPTSAHNFANCEEFPPYGPNYPVSVGSYTGSASRYGTFDQGGNVWEWTETIADGGKRVMRGGSYTGPGAFLKADFRTVLDPTFYDYNDFGFRIAMVPEPSTGLLMIAGVLGIAGSRRGRA